MSDLRDLYPIAEEISLIDRNEFHQKTTPENLIDFILVYEETLDDNNDSFERAQKAMRKNFEANLQHYGLILTHRKYPLKNHRQRVFVLITTPFDKLLEMCEITRTYLPIDHVNPFLRQLLTYPILNYGLPKIFLPNEIVFKENNQRSNFVFYPYSKRLDQKFARHYNSRTNSLFTIGITIFFCFFLFERFFLAQRTRLTFEILSRMPLLPPITKRCLPPTISNNTTFESLTINFPSTTRVSFSSISNDDIINHFNRHPIAKILSSHQYAYGINILIKIGIYLTAYPPHEEYRSTLSIDNNQEMNTRELLYFYWAQIKHVSQLNIIPYSIFRYLKYNLLN
jgi:hypothetical protein